MFQPSSIPFWTAITAVAAVGQCILLVVNAWFVWSYLRETTRLRIAAERQVTASQSQVKASQGQVAASQSQATAAFQQLAAIRHQTAVAQDQLEGQIRPAIVARANRYGIELVNIGSGPALHVQLSPVNKGQAAFVKPGFFEGTTDPIPFLEMKQVQQTVLQLEQPNHQYPGAPVLGDRSLQCTYKSLSGRIHYTVVDFADGRATATRFYEYEPEE